MHAPSKTNNISSFEPRFFLANSLSTTASTTAYVVCDDLGFSGFSCMELMNSFFCGTNACHMVRYISFERWTKEPFLSAQHCTTIFDRTCNPTSTCVVCMYAPILQHWVQNEDQVLESFNLKWNWACLWRILLKYCRPKKVEMRNVFEGNWQIKMFKTKWASNRWDFLSSTFHLCESQHFLKPPWRFHNFVLIFRWNPSLVFCVHLFHFSTQFVDGWKGFAIPEAHPGKYGDQKRRTGATTLNIILNSFWTENVLSIPQTIPHIITTIPFISYSWDIQRFNISSLRRHEVVCGTSSAL